MSDKKQTAVKELGIAFREWQKDWDSFEQRRKDQPISFDDFIKPFLEKEKQHIIDAFENGQDNIDSDGCHIDMNGAEQYFKETYEMKKYIGECKGNDGGGCFLDSCGHDCGCFTVEESQKQQKYDEMLEALKGIEALCDNQNETHESIWRIANAVLKEAKEL